MSHQTHARFQNDMLMWLMDEAQGQEQSVRNLAIRILTVNFTAIHTSSMVRRGFLPPYCIWTVK